MSKNKLRETVKDREAWHAAVHGLAERVREDSGTEQEHPQAVLPPNRLHCSLQNSHHSEQKRLYSLLALHYHI